MDLTPDDRDILAGQQGPILRKALSVLVRFGETFGARDLVQIRSAHLVVAGAFILFLKYMRFLRDIASEGLQVRVPTSINPRPFDPGDASLLGRIAFMRQGELERLYARIGCHATHTCTPHLATNAPRHGDPLAWAESSAVANANSVLGARTNQNPAMIDVCSALLGRTPRYGLLLDENRLATHLVTVETAGKIDYGLLGYVIARELVTGVPLIEGIHPTDDELKTLGATSGAAGAIALFHVLGVTPEARALGRDLLRDDCQRLTITDTELKAAEQSLRGDLDRPTHIIVGCPHLSTDELGHIATTLGEERLRSRLWLLACERVRQQVADTDAGRYLRAAGAQLKSLCPIYFHDTPRLFGKRILTDSVKLAHHAGVTWAPLDDCLRAAQR
ncbi:MAG: aconitase X [Armatimonadota bacterium]|jgi:predicted aconitase